MDNKNFLTQELQISRRRMRNKTFVGIFLLIAISTLILKIVTEILLDLGYHNGEFHFSYWQNKEIIAKAYDVNNPDASWQSMIEKHPNIFWHFTQFTWITTIIIIFLMMFRLFKYDQKTLPRWIKWIMTQSTISLLAMYDFIVGVVFWSSMYEGFSNSFNPDLWWQEIIITISVHSIIPIIITTYSIIYLIRDKKASILKELFVFKGMIYPIFYILYYLLISATWKDPYPLTDLHNNFLGEIWKLPFVILTLYSMLGFLILFHNILLLKFNKKYDPRKDYEVLMRRSFKIEKIQRKYIRKVKIQ